MSIPSAAAGPEPQGPSFPGHQPPAPPRKKRTWLIVLVVILALLLIGIASCVALVGSAGKAINDTVTEVQESQKAEDNKNAPREVTPGKAFEIGKHQTLAGWKVKKDDSLGDPMFNVTGKVKK